MEANALPGDRTIILGPGVHQLTLVGGSEALGLTGDLDVRDQGTTLTIVGAGPGATVIDASALGDRVFDNTLPVISGPGASLVLRDLTLRNGAAPGNEDSGGILAAGSVTRVRCSLEGCSSNNRGGVSSNGTLLATECTIARNSAPGGSSAMLLGGTSTVVDCVIEDNSTTFRGTVTVNPGGALAMSNCSILRNSTGSWGGAAVLSYGDVVLTDCELRQNTGGQFGPVLCMQCTLGLVRCGLSQDGVNCTGMMWSAGGRER